MQHEWKEIRLTGTGCSQNKTRGMVIGTCKITFERLREMLEVAIQGSGAFRRFKDALYPYPEAQENWFKFRAECEQRLRLDWLNSEGIEPEFE